MNYGYFFPNEPTASRLSWDCYSQLPCTWARAKRPLEFEWTCVHLLKLSISIMQSKLYLPHSGKLTSRGKVKTGKSFTFRNASLQRHLQVLPKFSSHPEKQHTWRLFFLYLHFFKSFARALLHYLKYTEKGLLTLKRRKWAITAKHSFGG